MNLATDPEEGGRERERGRTRSRSPAPGQTTNPFADTAEPSNLSLRGVSPRPMNTSGAGAAGKGKEEDNSPTERRSMFRENV